MAADVANLSVPAKRITDARTVAGVTAVEAADAAELPTVLVAVTVNV
jgi:hypothetical protein